MSEFGPAWPHRLPAAWAQASLGVVAIVTERRSQGQHFILWLRSLVTMGEVSAVPAQ